MSDDTQTDGLHLPSLSIRGFRGINRLDIGRLGRVTLLAGRNGVGKTTVLEAARVFAQRGSALCLYEFLMDREELESHADDDEERGEYPAFEALFHGRQPTYGSKISIGSADSTTALSIEAVRMDDLSEEWLRRLASGVLLPDAPVLKTVFNGLPDYQPVFDRELGGRHAASVRRWRTQRGGGDVEWPPDAACVVLGPGPPSNWDIAEFWDEIALTPSEPLALEALRLACSVDLDGVAVVARQRRSFGRRVLVKLSEGGRVPLRSLGDGAVRMFAAGAAVANAANGFLLINEAENGIHHTLQQDYWRLMFRAAREHNVQIFATTHSWDCVAGFARAACNDKESEGVALRLEPDDDDGGVRAIEYTEGMLKVAADQGIEVR